MKVFGALKIDGHFEVIELLKMNLADIYNNINVNYFNDKNNILITQEKCNGKLIDFMVFRPKKSEIFWLQSKYIINENNIKPRNNYIKEVEKFKITFKNIFGINLTNIYLLYISSFEYNKDNSSRVFAILEKNKINCLFYSVKKMNFTYDFIYEIETLESREGFIKSNNKNFNYMNQINSQMYEEDSKYIGKKTNHPKDEDYKNFQKILANLKESDLEKKEHMKLINYLVNENVFTFNPKEFFGDFAFYTTNYNSMIFYKTMTIQAYYVHCELLGKEINYEKKIGIIFPNIYNNKNIYYDIKLKKEISYNEYKNKFGDLGYFYGEFLLNNNASINIEIIED